MNAKKTRFKPNGCFFNVQKESQFVLCFSIFVISILIGTGVLMIYHKNLYSHYAAKEILFNYSPKDSYKVSNITLEEFFHSETDWKLRIIENVQKKKFFERSHFVDSLQGIHLYIFHSKTSKKISFSIHVHENFQPPCTLCFKQRLKELNLFLNTCLAKSEPGFNTIKLACFALVSYFHDAKQSKMNHKLNSLEAVRKTSIFFSKYPQHEQLALKAIDFAYKRMKDVKTLKQFKKIYPKIERQQKQFIRDNTPNADTSELIISLMQTVNKSMFQGLCLPLEGERIKNIEKPWDTFLCQRDGAYKKERRKKHAEITKNKNWNEEQYLLYLRVFLSLCALCTIVGITYNRVKKKMQEMNREESKQEVIKKPKVQRMNASPKVSEKVVHVEEEETPEEELVRQCRYYGISSPLLEKEPSSLTEFGRHELKMQLHLVQQKEAHQKRLLKLVSNGATLSENIIDTIPKHYWRLVFNSLKNAVLYYEFEYKSLRETIIQKNTELRSFLKNQ